MAIGGASGYARQSGMIKTAGFSGFFECEVLSTTDPTGSGMIKVKVLHMSPENASTGARDESFSFDTSSLSAETSDTNDYSGKITSMNGTWATPFWYSGFGSSGKRVKGSSGTEYPDDSAVEEENCYTKFSMSSVAGQRLPVRKGSRVVCFYFDNDPQQLYYFNASLKNHITTGSYSSKTTQDPEKNAAIAILYQNELGDLIVMDDNEEARVLMARIGNQQFRMEGNADHQFLSLMNEKFRLRLVDRSSEDPVSEDKRDRTGSISKYFAELMCEDGSGLLLDPEAKTVTLSNSDGTKVEMAVSGSEIKLVSSAGPLIQINGMGITIQAMGMPISVEGGTIDIRGSVITMAAGQILFMM